MAFERLEPWGWPLLRVVIDWGRSIVALLCSASSGGQFDRNKTPDITLAADTETPESESDDSDEIDGTADPAAEFRDAAAEPTSADILKAMREQNAFRF